MFAIKTEYCVEIRVPKKNGKKEFGSGYTLGPHWVITAYHVLFPESFDAEKSVEITWWDETAEHEKGDPVKVSRDEIVWFHKDYDIALILCEAPYEEVPSAWAMIGEQAPEGVTCECLGFLSNLHNEQGNKRRKEPCGILGRYSERQKQVDINGLNVVLKNDEYWAGFSGSPVFVNDRLVAIVRAVNTGETGLTASLIHAALGAVGGQAQVPFRDVPGFLVKPGRLDCWEKSRPGVVRELEQYQEVLQALKDAYAQETRKDVNSCNAATLTDRLLVTPDRTVVRCFLHVFRAANENTIKKDSIFCLDYLACVWLALMTTEQGKVRGVDAYKQDPTATALALDAVDPVLVDVEAQVAIGEKREINMQLKGDRLRSPFDLTPGHTTGFDPDDCRAAKDTVDMLALKSRPGFKAFPADVRRELEQFVMREATGVARLPDDDAKRGEEIGEQLDIDCLTSGASRYVRLPNAEGAKEPSALRDLHSWCPQLLLLDVSETENSERKYCLTALHRILYETRKFLAQKINP